MLIETCLRGRIPFKPHRISPRRGIYFYSIKQGQHVYVLTLETDKAHNARMTALRDKYFPKHLNKLSAHLTLFHALPESRLESSIIPVIQAVANDISSFDVTAATPFKLGKPPRGIGIAIPRDQGGDEAKKVRDRLLIPWKKENLLSRQDLLKTEGKGTDFLHYTIMNKVDDEAEVERAWKEMQSEFTPDQGAVEGLGLYRYERGWWRWFRGFEFIAPREPTDGGKH